MGRVRGGLTVSDLLTHGAVGFALVLCGLCTCASLAADHEADSPMAPVPRLVVEWRSDRLSVRAHESPWEEVLQALERQTGVPIIAWGTLIGTLTHAFEALPLEQGFRRLFRELNTVFFYATGPDAGTAATPLTQVWLIPRDDGATPRPAASPVRAAATALHGGPDSPVETQEMDPDQEEATSMGEGEAKEEEEARAERR